MFRLAHIDECEDVNGKPLPHIKFLNYHDYIEQGGSTEYIEYICNSMTVPKPGMVFSLPMTKGFWFWRKFYQIWIYKREPWLYELYGTKEEALIQQTLREELVRSKYWLL